MEIEDLIHPRINQVSLELYRLGFYRESLVNAVMALFDDIRDETGIAQDGAKLIAEVLKLENPRLMLADLTNESGQNIQKGFLQIFQGIYQALRNVSSHSLDEHYSKTNVMRYLITISALYEQIESSEKTVFLRYDGVYLDESEDTFGISYLRFYESGEVINVTSSSDSKPFIASWFNKENALDFDYLSKGTFNITDRKISFVSSSSAGDVIYKGVVRPEKIILKIESKINGHKSEKDYTFFSWKKLKSS